MPPVSKLTRTSEVSTSAKSPNSSATMQSSSNPENVIHNQELRVKFNIFTGKLQGLKELDVIHACKQVVGRNGIIGVQYIPRSRHWIIYASNDNSRDKLLTHGIDIAGIHVMLNSLSASRDDKTRISIHDVPMHVKNSSINAFLEEYCEEAESVIRCTVTDPIDKTKYYNGNRYTYVSAIKKPIPNFVDLKLSNRQELIVFKNLFLSQESC